MQIQNMRKRVPMKKLENAVEGKYYRNPFLRYDFLYSFSVFCYSIYSLYKWKGNTGGKS